MTTGSISYTLTRKRVKNINLRVTREGEIRVSANKLVPINYIEKFVLSKQDWILQAQAFARAKNEDCEELPYTKIEARAAFMPVVQEIFPLFANILGAEMPIIKVRLMKTRWGVCNATKKTITLNMRLMQKPKEALEYVVMHEFVHFLVHNHSAQFYAVLSSYMPDYKTRRALLK